MHEFIECAGRRMKIALDDFAYMPERAYEHDAGLDLKTPVDIWVYGWETGYEHDVIVDTGVHVELPPGTVGFLKSKSGLHTKCDITSEGVIDEGYTGSIKVKLYNHGFGDVFLPKGSKITQLVVIPILRPELEVVEKLGQTERGNRGFGSTGL